MKRDLGHLRKKRRLSCPYFGEGQRMLRARLTALKTSDYADTYNTAEQCRESRKQRAWPSLLMEKVDFLKNVAVTDNCY